MGQHIRSISRRSRDGRRQPKPKPFALPAGLLYGKALPALGVRFLLTAGIAAGTLEIAGRAGRSKLFGECEDA